MHVLEPKELEQRRQNRNRQKRRRHFKLPVKSLILLVIVVYASVSLLMPLPVLEAQMKLPKLAEQQVSALPWPAYGQAAMGATGYGLLDQSAEQKQAPIASMAKIVTALAVLKAKPMQPNSFGETVAITGPDVETYFAFASQGQSVIRVQAGTELTQYQALQALLLPSANNMADVLVRWAFGSTEAFLAFVNPYVDTLGLTNTQIADASGFSPQTVSTAVDVAKLAELAISQPIIAEIVAQPQAELPVAGIVRNTNFQLNTAGIIGIKTGNTDQAGGCYMFAAKRQIAGGDTVTVFGAVMGAPALARAMGDSLALLDATFARFEVISPLKVGAEVGRLVRADGLSVPVNVKDASSVVVWSGKPVRMAFALRDLSEQAEAGDAVGTLTLEVADKAYQFPLLARDSLPRHDYWWRLRHLGGLI